MPDSFPIRRNLRLKTHDYSAPCQYFVTLRTHKGQCTFGKVVDGTVVLNEVGQLVRESWQQLPKHQARIELGPFVVMPNHVHALVTLANPAAATGYLSLGAIIGSFKAAITTAMRREIGGQLRVWQRSYYEHIVRNEQDMARIVAYIEDNPVNWAHDEDNPDRPVGRRSPTQGD